MLMWNIKEVEFLILHYPTHGINFCATALNKSAPSIRMKSFRLNLKQDKNSSFFKEWQKRAALSKVGKKRPAQALVMKELHKSGKLKITESQKKASSIRMKKWIAKNGHPKGATGMKHTEESKIKISNKVKEMWKNMSKEMRDDYSKRASINGSKATMNRSNASWKAAWREIGGYKKYYRSRWEANYARYLESLKIDNKILDWKHEDTTFWFDGIKRGVMSYLPDFHIFHINETEEFHEVKGWMDNRSKTKLKRMAKYHPEINLILIDTKAYKLLEKEMKNIIPDW